MSRPDSERALETAASTWLIADGVWAEIADRIADSSVWSEALNAGAVMQLMALRRPSAAESNLDRSDFPCTTLSVSMPAAVRSLTCERNGLEREVELALRIGHRQDCLCLVSNLARYVRVDKNLHSP